MGPSPSGLPHLTDCTARVGFACCSWPRWPCCRSRCLAGVADSQLFRRLEAQRRTERREAGPIGPWPAWRNGSPRSNRTSRRRSPRASRHRLTCAAGGAVVVAYGPPAFRSWPAGGPLDLPELPDPLSAPIEYLPVPRRSSPARRPFRRGCGAAPADDLRAAGDSRAQRSRGRAATTWPAQSPPTGAGAFESSPHSAGVGGRHACGTRRARRRARRLRAPPGLRRSRSTAVSLVRDLLAGRWATRPPPTTTCRRESEWTRQGTEAARRLASSKPSSHSGRTGDRPNDAERPADAEYRLDRSCSSGDPPDPPWPLRR